MTLEMHARQRFLEEYRQVRYSEGRGSDDPAYYQALPFRDLSGRNSEMWAMRAKTYGYFEKQILAPIERRVARPLDVLDLGAGNGWMSYRLSLRNHRSVALDIFSDARDGLRACRQYAHRIEAIEADFDHLPFAENSFDLAIYNASLHYSRDYLATLSEVRKCLRKAGAVVILDSPIYANREDGERMVAERKETYCKRYGFRSDAMGSVEFLDEVMLQRLSRDLNLRWTIHRPWYGLRWHLRPLKARVQGRRKPSRFWILTGVLVADDHPAASANHKA
jgi:SAM-dependent methyltransferase